MKHFCFGKVELFQYFLGQIMEFGFKIIFFLSDEFHWNLVEINSFFWKVGILEISKLLKFWGFFMEVLKEKGFNQFEFTKTHHP